MIETKDYPNEQKPAEQGRDRIRILEDTDKDGKMDKATLFADQLSIPTSMVFANGGVIVSMAPQFLFLKDTNGDDKADVREVLFEGWSNGDTHAGPSNLQYGFDNWVWGVLGYSGFNGKMGGEDFRFGQGVYRLPDGSKFEFMGKTSNNTWYRPENGDAFISTANNQSSVYMPIAWRAITKGCRDGAASARCRGSTRTRSFSPTRRTLAGRMSLAGSPPPPGTTSTPRGAFRGQWNRAALIAAPTGNLLYRANLKQEGRTSSRRTAGMSASADEGSARSTRSPGRMAIWISGPGLFLVQHNPTPNPQRGGFAARNGFVGNALRQRPARHRALPDLASSRPRDDAIEIVRPSASATPPSSSPPCAAITYSGARPPSD
ncbi:MAG: hypothetical protein R3F11_28880 [Verrucomicrobiales bacterium]